jgi:hypothetical protein
MTNSKLISISVWGTRDLYLQGAIANARLVPVIYPGWTMRAYCAADVPILDVLHGLGVDVRIVPEAPGHAGLFWRFLPAGEPDVEHVIVRDADSRLNVREKAAVDAWIASGRPFHVMRDHLHHRNFPMLAGMWGCSGGSIPDIAERIARFSIGAVKHDDTKFLRSEIWPSIEDRCLVHSSVPEPLGGEPFPAHAAYPGFVGEIVDERAEARDVIALLLPSRGRPDAALAAARSGHATASAPERLCIEVGVEPDDADTYRRVFGEHAGWIRTLWSGGNYVRAIRELQRQAPAGIYGFCADDFRFETQGWDAAIRRSADDLPERLGLLYADDGLQGERLATAPFVTAEWIACVGDPLPGDYTHLFCDTEITAIARAAGLLRYLPAVKITHRHYLAGATFDATYERSAATHASGRAEFERRAHERQRIAERLDQESHTPRLSVLVSALVQHAERLDAQLASLHRQRTALPDASLVEVLVEPDAGEHSTAVKRRSLLKRARGKWVAFLDDEDAIADDALALLLDALESDGDLVTVAPRTGGFGTQTSSRVVALRRTIAVHVSAQDRAGREDFAWSGTLSGVVKSTTTIAVDVFRAENRASPRARSVASGGARAALGTSSSLAAPGLPSPAQQLLLTAAVGREQRARDAWRRWVAEIGPESADGSSIRLFPLAWWNLHRLGVDGIELNALKPHYWRSWAASMERSRRVAEIGRAFDGAGVRALLLRGFAIAIRHHAQPALRPTGDLAFLIPASYATQAASLVEAAGWQATPAPAEPAARRPVLSFRDRTDQHLTLHLDSLLDGRRAATRNGWWQRSEPVLVDGVALRVLCPADQLVDVCARAFRWSAVPRAHWAADVAAIVTTSASRLEARDLVAAARARRALLRTRDALRWVRDTLEIGELDAICRHLDAAWCGVADRLDAWIRLRPSSTGRNLLTRWLDERPGG